MMRLLGLGMPEIKFRYKSLNPQLILKKDAVLSVSETKSVKRGMF